MKIYDIIEQRDGYRAMRFGMLEDTMHMSMVTREDIRVIKATAKNGDKIMLRYSLYNDRATEKVEKWIADHYDI